MNKYAALLLACLLLPAQALAYTAHAKTVRDGDSIAAYGPEDALVNIRLYGIDAPEYKQPYGLQAKKRLSKLLGKREFQVEPMDTDRYGRTVALLRLPDGALVNEALVAEGAAWVYEQYCREAELCRHLRELQDTARAERRGLWAEADPTPPWEWRKQHKTEEWYKAPVRAVKRLTHKVKVVLHR
jgi:endonuclease YncB( thermonuclease family)